MATVLVLLAVLAGWLTARAVDAQEHRLLEDRSREVALVMSTSIAALSADLETVGASLHATGGDPAAFRSAVAAASDAARPATFAHVVRERDGLVARLASGTAVHEGDVLTGPRLAAVEQALATGAVVPTTALGTEDERSLGLALGPPVAPAGTAVYQETVLGPLVSNTSPGDPFSDLKVVLYASTRKDTGSVLATRAVAAGELPLEGDVVTTPLAVGATTWALDVAPYDSLVGPVTGKAGWIVAGTGVLVALLVGAVVEAMTRRRDSALALYRAERRLAENLQRGFLPALPEVEGVEVAARYLTGSKDQQVGGDWYDVFVLDDGGGTGLVIGDVLGHDINAAVVMSRVQTALRAFAHEGGEPAAVLDRLDEHLEHVQADRLTTVFYGILEPCRDDGCSLLRYTNAGHLHPLVRHADGRVEALEGVRPRLLGLGGMAVAQTARTQSEVLLRPGATVVLFTDGLVELPGLSLTDALHRLEESLRSARADATPEELCALLVDDLHHGEMRDDVAVLAVRLSG